MAGEVAFFLAAFSSLFTIINPFSTTSVFLTITRGDSKEKKALMARRAAIIATFMLIIFSFAGNYILSFFSVTIDAFKIAGGIIVASLGLRMVKFKREHLKTDKERQDASDKDDISVIPLAFPMMSGPGAITAAIVLMGDVTNSGDFIGLVLAIISVCWVSYLILSQANIVDKYIGVTEKRVIDRLMGLIVMVVGVQFVIDGVGNLLTVWF